VDRPRAADRRGESATGAPLCEVSAGTRSTSIWPWRCQRSFRLARGAAKRRATAWRSWRRTAGSGRELEKFSLLDTCAWANDHRHGDHRCARRRRGISRTSAKLIDKIDGTVTSTGRRCVHYILREPLGRVGLHRAVELSLVDGCMEGRAGARAGNSVVF